MSVRERDQPRLEALGRVLSTPRWARWHARAGAALAEGATLHITWPSAAAILLKNAAHQCSWPAAAAWPRCSWPPTCSARSRRRCEQCVTEKKSVLLRSVTYCSGLACAACSNSLGGNLWHRLCRHRAARRLTVRTYLWGRISTWPPSSTRNWANGYVRCSSTLARRIALAAGAGRSHLQPLAGTGSHHPGIPRYVHLTAALVLLTAVPVLWLRQRRVH